MKLMDKAKQAALAAAVKTGLGYLEKDPEVNILYVIKPINTSTLPVRPISPQ